jgi:hypothetical protein
LTQCGSPNHFRLPRKVCVEDFTPEPRWLPEAVSAQAASARVTWGWLVQIQARLIGALAVLVGSGFMCETAAGGVTGEWLGVFEGNDSEDSILLDLGVEVIRLDRVELPDTTSDGLRVLVVTTRDGREPIAGEWGYVGLSEVDLIVVKAGNLYGVYRYNVDIGGATSRSGLWDTSRLDNKELSHLTAYRVVPEPATGVLLGMGIALLGLRAAIFTQSRATTGKRALCAGRAVSFGNPSYGCPDGGRPARHHRR